MRIDEMEVQVHWAGRFTCRPGWSLTPARTRAWTDLDLWTVIEGAGEAETPEGVLPLHPGVCLLLRGGEDYTFRVREGAFAHYWTHFDYVDSEGKPLRHQELALPALRRVLGATELAFALFDRTIDESRSPQADLRRASRWFGAALMEIRRQEDRSAEAGAGEAENSLRRLIREMCTRIREHPAERFEVSALARSAGVSRGYFSRVFRREVGVSAQEFIIGARMRAARFLLQDSTLRIGEVARAAGYEDIFFFSRHFRRIHGVSASDFRKGLGSRRMKEEGLGSRRAGDEG